MSTLEERGRQRLIGRIARKLVWAAGLVGAIYVSLCLGLYWAMSQPPDFFGRMMARTPPVFMMVLPFETLWMHARAGALKPGDMAPDLRLPTLDHSAIVQLSSHRGSRPVVLVFGSYT